jgi:hypothetical protein
MHTPRFYISNMHAKCDKCWSSIQFENEKLNGSSGQVRQPK